MTFVIPLQPPEDGFDDDEKAFASQMYVEVYKRIKNPEDKFIVFAVLDMGFSQEIVAEMIGKSQVAVSTRIKKIKNFFQNQTPDNKNNEKTV